MEVFSRLRNHWEHVKGKAVNLESKEASHATYFKEEIA